MARKLSLAGQKVLLLEAGGLDYSQQSQDFYECEIVSHNAWPQFSRLRYFGGTSNHWSGRCRPFDRSDFKSRVINGLPGWPIRYSEIEPYLDEAMDILDLDKAMGFQPANDDLLKRHFSPDAYTKSPPTRFKGKYLSEIENSKNIDCFYNATAIDMQLDRSHQAITHIKIRNYNNYEPQCLPRSLFFVLAALKHPALCLTAKTRFQPVLAIPAIWLAAALWSI